MIVLDTNVISELLRPAPDSSVVGWLDQQSAADVLLTAITAAELRAAVALLPSGRRLETIGSSIERLLAVSFSRLVLAFDVESTPAYARIVASRRKSGRPVSTADAQIAAICLTRGATLATRNVKDFDGMDLPLIDPWQT